MLETLAQTNIGHLNLTEPPILETDFSFNPRRDISDRDWENMKESLYQRPTINFIQQAGFMRALFPDRSAELEVDQMWDKVGRIIDSELERFSKDRQVDYYTYAVKEIADSLAVFPQQNQVLRSKYTQLKEIANKKTLGVFGGYDIYKEMGKFYGENTKRDFIEALTRISRQDLQEYSDLEHDKKRWRDDYNFIGDSHGIKRQVMMAANFNLTFPESSITVPAHAMDKCKKILARTISGEDFTRLAYCLAVLSASQIVHTNHGVELVFPEIKKTFTEEIPQLPETRKF